MSEAVGDRHALPVPDVLPLPNPLIPGFHPDPSVVLVDGVYYLITSTFEYVPGMPVHRSTDLVSWERIGNVATTEAQLGVAQVASGLGVFAPTIRHHDGRFHVIVTIMGSPKGCVVYTAEDAAGPWSDGVTITGITGIDPDLAWAENGDAYVTYSGFSVTDAGIGGPVGIQQVRVDLETGTALEEPRTLWSGTGLKFPEAPHLYRRGDDWYLMLAEGGTERGHAVSVARGPSIEGPFEGAPHNPITTAAGTDLPIQNTGHADLVTAPDGTDVLVLLGVRPLGGSLSFSPLGRETFATRVTWQDGWPVVAPVVLHPRPGATEERFDLGDPAAAGDPGWLAVGRPPADLIDLDAVPGRLVLHGDGGMDVLRPAFVGRRQQHLTSTTEVAADVASGSGGIALRYDDECFVSLEARADGGEVVVIATASAASIRQRWTAVLPAGEVALRIETAPPPVGFVPGAKGGDRIRLVARVAGEEAVLAELDGRHWSMESAASFTGRVVGLFASAGPVAFSSYSYLGSEAS